LHVGVKVVFLKKQFEEVRTAVSCSKATVWEHASWSKLFYGGFFWKWWMFVFCKSRKLPKHWSETLYYGLSCVVLWEVGVCVCVCVSVRWLSVISWFSVL